MNPLIPCPFTYGDIPGGGVPAVIVVSQTAPTVTQNQQAQAQGGQDSSSLPPWRRK